MHRITLLYTYFTGVALLPFVDEKRLHRTLSDVYNDLTEDESKIFIGILP